MLQKTEKRNEIWLFIGHVNVLCKKRTEFYFLFLVVLTTQQLE